MLRIIRFMDLRESKIGRIRQVQKILSFAPRCIRELHTGASWKASNLLPVNFFGDFLAFEKHLGPVFVQVNELFTPNRKEELFNFLGTLPKDIQFFLEVRHPGLVC